MNFEKPNQILRHLFAEKKAKNPAYSTRALARDLGMSQAYVSLLLNDKRALTIKQAARLCAVLGLSSVDTQKLMTQVMELSPEGAKWIKRWKKEGKTFVRPKTHAELEFDQFQIICRWYHYAVLDLTTTQNFKPDPKWIGERLGITAVEAQDALDRLVRVGLLAKEDKTFVKKKLHMRLGELPKSEIAVRSHHKEMMEKATKTLEHTQVSDFNRRSITSLTMGVDPKKINEAKDLIEEFKERMAALLTTGEISEVYQLNVQLFPLTTQTSHKSKGKNT